MKQQSIIVIGAGIVGVSTALWLQRDGHKVTLIDKDRPGQAASYGNAGLLAGWAVAPVTGPSLWRDAPKMLLNPRKPLFMKWRSFPKLLPWLAGLMSHANDADTRRITSNLAPLLLDTVDQHRALVRGTPLESWIKDSKINFVYSSEQKFKNDAYSWEMKASHGLIPTVITGQDVQDEEPILGPNMGCIAQLSGWGHISDPGNYIAKLADIFVAQGGTLVQAAVQDFAYKDGRISQVQTSDAAFDCDCAVLTAGIWSKDLMTKLGLNIPMQTERGYHIVFENPSVVPNNPMLMSDGKFGANPMDMGLRCAGTVELGTHHAAASQAPIRALEYHVKRAFPNLKYSGRTEWMGFRPTPIDSTPLIGEIGQTGIYTGFGHQHVGLTGGPKTGRLIAQMIGGNRPNMDMSAYSPERF